MPVPRVAGTQGVLQCMWKLRCHQFHRSSCHAHPAKGGASSTFGGLSEEQAGPQAPQDIKHISQTLKLVALIRAFRSRGHFAATLGECAPPPPASAAYVQSESKWEIEEAGPI